MPHSRPLGAMRQKFDHYGLTVPAPSGIADHLPPGPRLISNVALCLFVLLAIISLLTKQIEQLTVWLPAWDVDPKSKAPSPLHVTAIRINAIASATRKNLFVVDNDLDLELVASAYEALGKAVKAGPDILSQLAKSISRFERRKSNA